MNFCNIWLYLCYKCVGNWLGLRKMRMKNEVVKFCLRKLIMLDFNRKWEILFMIKMILIIVLLVISWILEFGRDLILIYLGLILKCNSNNYWL